MKTTLKFLVFLLSIQLLGCATAENPDPLEKMNRGIYAFNKTVDKYVFLPIAKGYMTVTPEPVEQGIRNFYYNLAEIPTIGNDLLQFKFFRAMDATGRLVINSTLGILGFIDVASRVGVKRHKEDFGQTLGHWGYKNSAYFVIPFLGPSTIRDTIGLPVTYWMSVYPHIEPDSDRNWMLVLDGIDKRAQIIEREKLLKAVAVDRYRAERDAYLQHRSFLIEDGMVDDTAELEDLDF